MEQVNIHLGTLPLVCDRRASKHSTAMLVRHVAMRFPGWLPGKKRSGMGADNLVEADQTLCSQM